MKIAIIKMILFEIIIFISTSVLCTLYDVDKFIAGLYVMINYLCLSNVYDKVVKKIVE